MRGIMTASAVLGLFAFGPLDRCTSESSEAKPGASVATSATPNATPSATPAGGDDFCKLQPYPKRCDAACKAAFHKAVEGTCAADIKAFTNATSDPAFGKCVLACRPPGSDGSCVGAADKAGCECQTKCYRSLPPDALEKAKRAARCYEPQILPACQ